MCYPTTCPNCRKTTWGGCGQHADSVMKSVPAAQQCTCAGTSDSARRGFFSTFFGR